MDQGNMQVMLCERGIKSFETYTRYTLDVSAVPVAKRLSHLPVIVDPSHATGKWHLVKPMAMAAVAAGAEWAAHRGASCPGHRPVRRCPEPDHRELRRPGCEVQQVAQAVGRGPAALPDDAPVAAGMIASGAAATAELRSVQAPTCLTGRIAVPGDKSISHRAILLNALATAARA